MKYLDKADISIRQMQFFLTIADQKSFSIAAIMLNISQSTLSKSISQLERMLGVKLINREYRPVMLTAAGQILYDEWNDVINRFDSSLDNAYENMEKSRNKLTVGLIDSINAVHYMPALRKKMLESFPGLDLRFEYTSFATWRSKLKSGAIDLALTIMFETRLMDEDFSFSQLSYCDKKVCMLPTNPFADRKEIELSELKDMRFLLVSPKESPAYSDYVLTLCHTYDFEPKIGGIIDNANDLFSALNSDNEVIITDKYFRDFNNPQISKLSLINIKSGMIGVWRKKGYNDYIDSFLNYMKQTQEL